jgi:integrase
MAFWGPEVEWHERDVVVPAFRQWLEAQGWDTETETEFVDVVAHRVNQATIVQVQAWMGHADVQTTMKYMHHRSRAGDARLLSAAFKPKKRRSATKSVQKRASPT